MGREEVVKMEIKKNRDEEEEKGTELSSVTNAQIFIIMRKIYIIIFAINSLRPFPSLPKSNPLNLNPLIKYIVLLIIK